MNRLLTCRLGFAAVGIMIASPALAKDVEVFVDAHSGPWMQSVNPKLPYGLGDNRAPKMIWAANLLVGSSVTFAANGQTTTEIGGGGFDPNGNQSWSDDHGYALFPSHYMSTKKTPIHLNELVGAFVDADGEVIGKAFPIGVSASVAVPDGAAAISLGLNDDKYSDNSGGITVKVHIPEANVIVGPANGN